MTATLIDFTPVFLYNYTVADQIKNASESFSPETQKASSSPNNLRKPEAHNIPKQNFEAGAKAAEFVDAAESAEVANEVSEVMREQSEQKGDAVKTKGKAKMTPAQIKAQLLQKAPTKEIMASEVRREIEKEIKYLHKRAKKIMRKTGNVNAFELNNIVKKIRELRALLLEIAKMGVDALKNLWVRFVKGMI